MTSNVTILLAEPGPTMRVLGSGGFLFGLVLGFLGGVAFQFMRRAWVDVSKTKGLVSGLRQTAWSQTRTAVIWLAVLAFLVVLAVSWATNGDLVPARNEAPASVPTTHGR